MKVILLALGVAQKEKPGSFGAELYEDILYLPVKVFRYTRALEWRNAAEFFLGTLSFSESLQEALGWTADQCRQASDELGKLLRDYLPDNAPDPLGIEHHPKGTLPPDTD